MEVSGILDPRCIALELAATGKHEAIGELIGLATSARLVADPAAAESAILAREALMSTGIGQSVALPHALIPGFGRTVMAVGRSLEGIDFQALDGAPVHLIILILGAKGEEPFHLVLLSRLARVLGDAQVRRMILDAPTVGEIARLLGQ